MEGQKHSPSIQVADLLIQAVDAGAYLEQALADLEHKDDKAAKRGMEDALRVVTQLVQGLRRLAVEQQ